MTVSAEPISQRAALDQLDDPDTRATAIQWWLPRLVREIYGDHIDADKDGIKAEVRQLKRWAMLGGTVAILLSVVQTVCTLVSTFHPHLTLGQ